MKFSHLLLGLFSVTPSAIGLLLFHLYTISDGGVHHSFDRTDAPKKLTAHMKNLGSNGCVYVDEEVFGVVDFDREEDFGGHSASSTSLRTRVSTWGEVTILYVLPESFMYRLPLK